MARTDRQPGALTTATPLPILFAHFGDDWIRGSEMVLLDLLTHLDRKRFQPVVWCNGRQMADACNSADVLTHRSDFRFYFDAGSPPFSLAAYLRLVREGIELGRRYRVGVFHANSAAPAQWLFPVARSLGRPLLSHLHIAYLRRSRYALAVHQADLIVGVSRQVLEGPVKDGFPSERTRVIYNGIDSTRLQPRPGSDLRASLGIAPQATVIGSVGSLIRRKGHDVLIRAVRDLSPRSQTHLVVAGDGPEQDSLRRLAAALDVSERVHWLGHQSSTGDVYAACDVIALASRAESFGLVLVEAGCRGLPVVATGVGGIPEVVLDNETGLLVPPDDVAALAAALQRLVADPALRRRLGEAGRQRALSAFSVQRMAAEFGRIYEEMAVQPRARLGWASLVGRTLPYARVFSRSPR